MQPVWAEPLVSPGVALAEEAFVGVGEGSMAVAVTEGTRAEVAEGTGVWLEAGKEVGLAVGITVWPVDGIRAGVDEGGGVGLGRGVEVT